MSGLKRLKKKGGVVFEDSFLTPSMGVDRIVEDNARTTRVIRDEHVEEKVGVIVYSRTNVTFNLTSAT